MYSLLYTKFYTTVLEVKMVVPFEEEREGMTGKDMRCDSGIQVLIQQ